MIYYLPNVFDLLTFLFYFKFIINVYIYGGTTLKNTIQELYSLSYAFSMCWMKFYFYAVCQAILAKIITGPWKCRRAY